jgi:1-aminocyclopropane-1-carboxylate deaminase/D-cysteine desulfhydrase-like pyridoxal-dependent ACC family enzyme
MDAASLRAQIDRLPRYPLAHRPTPLEPMTRFSRALGGPLVHIKRDDCTGLAIGGNKTRHNEFVLAEAIARGADLFVWGGGVQSNNCRQTAAACAKAGLDGHLVLTCRGPGGQSPPLQGNFLLDHLVGATYEFADVGFGEALDRRVAEVAAGFEAQGRRVFRWDRAIVTPLAAAAYVECFLEIIEQSRALGFTPGVLYVSSGGSTGAGLALAAHLLGLPIRIRNVAYVLWEWETRADMAMIANRTAELLGADAHLAADDFDVTFDYIAPGYGQQSPQSIEAIRLLARTEGILLDPIYTAKAMSALIDDVRSGRIARDASVVFVHTGGTPALFAYADEFASSGGRPAQAAGV